MALIASIIAYLGTVTAIIVTVVMSYDAFIYTPSHSINPQHTLTAAVKPHAAVAASSASAGKIARPSVAATSHPRSAREAKAAPQVDTAAERRAASARLEAARQKHTRRLARQARGREWASQQPPGGFGLGYAEEPPGRLYNAFPY
jgi:hypothetical protein